LEVQILLYYLKVFSIIIIIIFLIFFINIYSSTNKKLLLDNEYLVVPKGENISNIINTKIKNLNFLEIFIFKFYHKLNTYLFNKQLHYGDFYLGKNITFHKFLEILYEPSNILNKITIVEGWSKKELEDELSKHFTDIKEIPYNDILADTYFYEKNENINIVLSCFRNGLEIKTTVEKRTNKLDNKVIVFTGSLTKFTRHEARELVESNGGKVSSSISKKTSYLVSGEKSGSKLNKAKKLNVTILSETELLKLIQ